MILRVAMPPPLRLSSPCLLARAKLSGAIRSSLALRLFPAALPQPVQPPMVLVVGEVDHWHLFPQGTAHCSAPVAVVVSRKRPVARCCLAFLPPCGILASWAWRAIAPRRPRVLRQLLRLGQSRDDLVQLTWTNRYSPIGGNRILVRRGEPPLADVYIASSMSNPKFNVEAEFPPRHTQDHRFVLRHGRSFRMRKHRRNQA